MDRRITLVEFYATILLLSTTVSAESFEDMLCLDTNSLSCPWLKRHQKEPPLIESKNKNLRNVKNN